MMETTKYIYYQEGDYFVGWLEDYPDYRSQGKTLDELKENLKDIYQDITGGLVPHVRKRGEIVIG
jgi:predicted RNase H-like HicB family nuclease